MKKSFTENEPFFTPEPEPETKQGEASESTEREFYIPEGYRLIPESKTARIQILITPTVKENIRKAAEEEECSINELINRAIKKYLER